MGLIKKIDVPKYFAARRASRLVAARSVSYADATGVLEIRPRATSANASGLVADFDLENSSSGVSSAPAK
jgi:hypothetical protein